MATAPREVAHLPGCRFSKLCGSGSGEGFTPRPNLSVWAILCDWDDADAATDGIQQGVHARWAKAARQSWTVFLRPISRKGRWSGKTPFEPSDPSGRRSPLGVLTRATIRRRDLLRFWRHEPGISAAIGSDPNVAFKIGIGEVPLLHQVTFSIWPDAAAMARFARADGPHAQAIRAVRAGDWFREELYARFEVCGAIGTWSDAPNLGPIPEAA